jgi:hypothetical protein
MCRRVTYKSCGKPTWAGCGAQMPSSGNFKMMPGGVMGSKRLEVLKTTHVYGSEVAVGYSWR